jgi:hypothetical protein
VRSRVSLSFYDAVIGTPVRKHFNTPKYQLQLVGHVGGRLL